MATTTTNENWFDINYIEKIAYPTHFIPLLNNKRVINYCEKQLYRSLSYIGFSKSFCDSLIPNLGHLDFDTFHQKFDGEINDVQNGTYIQDVRAKYFTEEIIPSIPSSKLILDIGCGNGILAKQLANNYRFNKIIGCEWNSCPGWKDIIQEYGDKVEFHVVRDDTFSSFVKTYNPDAFVLTWVLHHMEWSTQHTYIKNLFDTMNPGTRVVILEEGVSTVLSPEIGQNDHDEFMSFSHQERQDVLTIYDWVANIFIQRRAMPIPASNRTMEEWESFFNKIGFNILSKRYIGYPVKDVINPQELFVLEKPVPTTDKQELKQ
jgi:SAM-dependent methyltransferase